MWYTDRMENEAPKIIKSPDGVEWQVGEAVGIHADRYGVRRTGRIVRLAREGSWDKEARDVDSAYIEIEGGTFVRPHLLFKLGVSKEARLSSLIVQQLIKDLRFNAGASGTIEVLKLLRDLPVYEVEKQVGVGDGGGLPHPMPMAFSDAWEEMFDLLIDQANAAGG